VNPKVIKKEKERKTPPTTATQMTKNKIA